MTDSLINKLIQNAQSDMYPFHMPGHKRQTLGDGAEQLPFALDVTEVDGFDNLQNPRGVLKELEEKAAVRFCAKKAFLLVNGSTCGILASVKALTQYGDKVLLARNCHKSVYNAVELCGLHPEYVMPQRAFDGKQALNFYGSVNPDSIAEVLDNNPDIPLVIITSPTYEGMCSDIARIAEICHSHHAKLLVDEAHGAVEVLADKSAHHSFLHFPHPAVTQGADVVVLSLHKTFPALTQTALLLTNDESMVSGLRHSINVFQTSSPSYILMASTESCLHSLSDSDAYDFYWQRLQRFYREANELKRLKILFQKNCNVHDSGKIIISTTKTALTGYALAALLRKNYLIETEMAAPDYVLAYTSVADTDDGFQRLLTALKQIDCLCDACGTRDCFPFIAKVPNRLFVPCERNHYKTVSVPINESQGRVAAETVMAYPPGSPCLTAGEVISGEIIAYIKQIKALGGELLFDSFAHDSELINVADL